MALTASPWEFGPGAITVPVSIWQGTVDSIGSTPAMAEYLHAAIVGKRAEPASRRLLHPEPPQEDDPRVAALLTASGAVGSGDAPSVEARRRVGAESANVFLEEPHESFPKIVGEGQPYRRSG